MTNFSDMPDVLTVPDLQKALRIGRNTAYRLIQSKEIQSIRIGKSIRIPKKYVVDFLKAPYSSGTQDVAEETHPGKFI